MSAKAKKMVHAVWCALASKEARGPELVLARIILAALGVKLGINFVNYTK